MCSIGQEPSTLNDENHSLFTTLDSGRSSPAANHKPILVGYAFGPKKMKSMSIVMAEASMSVSTVVTHLPPHLRNGNQNSPQQHSISQTHSKYQPIKKDRKNKAFGCESKEEFLVPNHVMNKDNGMHDDDSSSINSAPFPNFASEQLDLDPYTSSLSGSDETSLQRITCIFPKSFFLSSTSSSTRGDASCSMTATTTSSSSKFEMMHMQPMRVSFVPLDLDSPLEEQHGGEFDVILHKMTEDILCKSQLSVSDDNNMQQAILESERQALNRVKRLRQYKDRHPACSLVDHPTNVQALMSRSDIAEILASALANITTKSGMKVRSPRFQILDGRKLKSNQDIAEQISDAGFQYPLIIKPLTAAGTVQSHKMGILFGKSGLEHINEPSLLQEYSNHDGILYKVYVLGNKQWVYRRSSLPNLPEGESEDQNGSGFVEFDSQRPYPTLEDFGFHNDSHTEEDTNQVNVTSAEIRPVADCIRRAFGLELFGFDVLVTSFQNKKEREMLVVDVNYFPSYKEVPNFSQLLAQYLAQCGVEGRLRSLDDR
jgi:inositol-1,3,4-trisphosphate 5/6-kinase/inositol-tetrakisphosphate 1-kinase